jgi:hypothetical protein
MTDAQLEQVKEALTLAVKYVRDPDEQPPITITLGYRPPQTQIECLQEAIEEIEAKKYAAEFIRDTLASL